MDWIDSVIGKIVSLGHFVKMTGSRVTTHYNKDSDFDYVVYDPQRTLEKELKNSSSWTMGGSGNGEEFNSFKREFGETINLILVDKAEIFQKYCLATDIIKSVNPKTKAERIAYFDMVFGRKTQTEALPF